MKTTKTFELLIVLTLAVAPVAAQEMPAPTNDEPVAAQDKAALAKSEAVADQPAQSNKPGPTTRTTLPQDHEYQRVLRKFMGTLTEKDFDHGVTNQLTVATAGPDPEHQYRMHIMTMMAQPLVGWKRGIPAVNARPWLFLLSTIEGPEPAPTPPTVAKPAKPVPTNAPKKKGVGKIAPGPVPTPTGIVVPPVWPETLVAFAQWNYPGNPYYNSRPLMMRAFVNAAVRMIMLDDKQEHSDEPMFHRADWNAYQLVAFGSSYLGFKELLPPEVRRAYEAGLLKLGRRMMKWGIKGEEPNMDMNAPIGFWYVSKACNDPAFTQEAEAYARRLMTDPRYFHPAGYWVERGGLDVGFGGMANYYAVWAALMTDWPFAKETVERAYRLRAHLSLPEPDGDFNGPCEFNNRIGSPACEDQWHWDGARDHATAMVTDEAVHLVKLPTEEQLTGAAANRVGWFNGQIHGHLRNPYQRDHSLGYVMDDNIRGRTWGWRIWQSSNFPTGVNPGWEFYRKGAYARLRELTKKNSPLLKSPFLREGTFITNFADAFIVAKQPSFSAILHTGPVGTQDPADGLSQHGGPLGLGGGQLSAFWTPGTGSVLLGRRGGVSIELSVPVTRDKLTEWRTWPIHAVSGATAAGKVFTSARIVKPEVTADVKPDKGLVKVSGVIPATLVGQEGGIEGKMDYARTFTIDAKGVAVETVVSGDGKDRVAELYETFPVFLDDEKRHREGTPPTVTIEFQTSGKWAPATDAYTEKVHAVRITRYTGAVRITFDKPQRAKLSPTEWKDTFLSHAKCRNVLVDLLENGDKPAAVKDARKIGYTIAPVAGK